MPDTPPPTTWRLNRRAAAALAILSLAAVAAILALQLTRPDRLGDEAARQIENLVEKGRTDLALRHLGRYLERFPDDVDMAFLQARLMAEQVHPENASLNLLERLAQGHQQLVIRFPDHPESNEVRARLADYLIRISDVNRTSLGQLGMPEQGVGQGRYNTAVTLVNELIDRKRRDGHPVDPNDFYLRARGLEGMSLNNAADPQEVVKAYEEAFEASLEEAGRLEQARAQVPSDAEAVKASEAAWDTSAEIALRLAQFHRDRRNDPAAAEAALDRLAAARPDAVAPLLVRYRYFVEARDARRAKEALDEALRRDPADPEVLLVRADNALRLGDTAGAREAMAALPPGSLDSHPARIGMINGFIDLVENNPEQAAAEWLAGLNLVRGNDADLNWWLAYVRIQGGQLDEAEAPLARYRNLTRDDDDPRLRLLQALQFEKRGNYQSAISELNRLRQVSERLNEQVRDEVLLALGRCHEGRGDTAEADRHFRMASQASPRSTGPITAQARLLERSGRLPEAIRRIEQALAEQARSDRGEDPKLLLLLAQFRLIEQGNREPSRRDWTDFDRALDRVGRAMNALGIPATVDLVLLDAERNALSGRVADAANRLDQALERTPSSPRLWEARAEVAFRSGRPEEAIRFLEEGEEKAGDGATLRMAKARILIALGRGQEAQRHLTEGIDRLSKGQQGQLWEAAGRLRMAQADYDGARTAFKNWERLAPSSPDPILAMINVALLDGRIDEADVLSNRLPSKGEKGDLTSPMAAATIRLHQAERTTNPDERKKLLSEGVSEVDGVLAYAPNLAGALLLRGRLREALDLPGDAINDYRKAWEGGNREALARLADLLAKQQEFTELEQLVAKETDAELKRAPVQALLIAGQADRAAQLIGAAGNPNAPTGIQAWRAQMLSATDRLDELEGLLRARAERSAAGDAAPWLELIAVQARLGRNADALEQTIRQAMSRVSGVPSPLLEAQLRWAAGDARAADEALEGPLNEEIVDPELMMGAALYYHQTGRLERAEPLLERLRSNPQVKDAAELQLAMFLAERSAGDPATWSRARDLAAAGPDPNDPLRRLTIAVVQSRSPDPAQRKAAIDLFQGLMGDLPVTDARAAEARRQLVLLLLDLGQAERAVQIAAISAGQAAPSPEAITLHARALLQAGRLTEADSEIRRLELLKPGDPAVAELRADRERRANTDDPMSLVRSVEERIDSPGGTVFARTTGLHLLGLGTPEAVEAADRIAKVLGDRSPGRRWVSGMVMAARGQSAEALDRCSEALAEVDLTDPVERTGLAETILKAVLAAPDSDRVAASNRGRAIIAAMLKRRPGDPDLLSAAAILCHQAGEYRAEADFYRQVLDRKPGDPLALYNLALVLSEGLGAAEEALPEIERLLARVGSQPDVLGARGVILTRLGRFDEAIADLERAVEIDPTAARHAYLAWAYRKAGRDQESRGHLEQARLAGLDPASIDRWHRDELRGLLAP